MVLQRLLGSLSLSPFFDLLHYVHVFDFNCQPSRIVGCSYSRTSVIRTPIIQTPDYPDTSLSKSLIDLFLDFFSGQTRATNQSQHLSHRKILEHQCELTVLKMLNLMHFLQKNDTFLFHYN